MAISSSNISSSFGSVGAAVRSIFGGKASGITAEGYENAALGYERAAGLVGENIGITRQSTALRRRMAEREALSVIGGQQSDIAGAGFAMSGTALDLLRDSAAQARLEQELLAKQGQIDVNALRTQQETLYGQADLARMQAASSRESEKSSGISAVIHGVSAVMSLI